MSKPSVRSRPKSRSAKKKKPEHPMQPIVWTPGGIVRFKRNAIVCHLLDHGGIDMNALAVMDFSREDREQFAQLIGYSVSGFGDLSYVRPRILAAADKISDALVKARKRRKASP